MNIVDFIVVSFIFLLGYGIRALEESRNRHYYANQITTRFRIRR